jgi:hypothetical protein
MYVTFAFRALVFIVALKFSKSFAGKGPLKPLPEILSIFNLGNGYFAPSEAHFLSMMQKWGEEEDARIKGRKSYGADKNKCEKK